MSSTPAPTQTPTPAPDPNGFGAFYASASSASSATGQFPQQSANAQYGGYSVYKRGAKTAQETVPGSNIDISPTSQGIPYALQTKESMMRQMLISSINDPSALIDLQQKMIRAGYLNPRSKSFQSGEFSTGDATWYALDTVFDKATKANVDYHALLDKELNNPKSKNAYNYYLRMFGQSGLGQGQGDTTVTNSSTNVSTKMDAQALLTQSLQNELGRDPSQQELNAFTTALQAYERGNPNVTTTTTTGQGSGSVNSSSATTGGANPQTFAENYAMQPGNQDEVTTQRGRGFVDQFERMMKGG